MFSNLPRERTDVELSMPDECPECGYRSFDIRFSFSSIGGQESQRRIDARRRTTVKCSACCTKITEQTEEDCRA